MPQGKKGTYRKVGRPSTTRKKAARKSRKK